MQVIILMTRIYALRLLIKLNFRHKFSLICLFNKTTVFCMTYELNFFFKFGPF